MRAVLARVSEPEAVTRLADDIAHDMAAAAGIDPATLDQLVVLDPDAPPVPLRDMLANHADDAAMIAALRGCL